MQIYKLLQPIVKIAQSRKYSLEAFQHAVRRAWLSTDAGRKEQEKVLDAAEKHRRFMSNCGL